MCIETPDNVDDNESFGALGIAMQSIKCIPKESKVIAIIGLDFSQNNPKNTCTGLSDVMLMFSLIKMKLKMQWSRLYNHCSSVFIKYC